MGTPRMKSIDGFKNYLSIYLARLATYVSIYLSIYLSITMYEGVYMHVWIYHDVSMGIIEQQSTIKNKYLTDEE